MPRPNTRPTAIIDPVQQRSSPHRDAATVGLIGILAIGLTGCLSVFRIEGSGTPEIVTFDLADFTEVSVGRAFDVDVVVGDAPRLVEVTVDDNLVEHLDVSVDGDRLTLGFDRGNYDFDTEPTATLRLPTLTEVEANGASTVRVAPDNIERAASIDLVRADASGASTMMLSAVSGNLVVDTSGTSTITIDGHLNELVAGSSGASRVNVAASANSVRVDASGASSIRLDDVDEVAGELSGASTLDLPSTASVAVDTSGASKIERHDG